MSDHSLEHLDDDELIENWVAALKALSRDYTNRDALAVVETFGAELRLRGLGAPANLVVSEIASIATQVRDAEAKAAPAIVDTVPRRLEDELMSFAAQLNPAKKSVQILSSIGVGMTTRSAMSAAKRCVGSEVAMVWRHMSSRGSDADQ